MHGNTMRPKNRKARKAREYRAVIFNAFACHASVRFVLVSSGAVVRTHRHRTSAPRTRPRLRSRDDAVARHAAVVVVSVAVRAVVGAHGFRAAARRSSRRRLVPVRSTNQRAVGRAKALAYRTAGRILLEAELAVHEAHRTLAANKRLLLRVIVSVICLRTRLIT